MLNSYVELNCDVLHNASGNRYVDGDDLRLVNLSPIALFSNYNLSTNSGKHLENIDHAHMVYLMYKLLTSTKGSDDLSVGFDRRRDKRRRELGNNKNNKGIYHVRIYLKDLFGFAEHQKTGTFGLGYKLTLTWNADNAVLNKGNAINNAKIKINSIDCYVPHYTMSLGQQSILMNLIVRKRATELHYPEKSVSMKGVKTQNFWSFELGTQEGNIVPTQIYVAFQQNDRLHDQNLNNDTFCRLPVTSAQCIMGTEKYPDSGILLNYDDDYYSQGYGQRKEVFRALIKDNILQPHISEDDYRSSNDGDDMGYNIYSFDI